MTTVQVANARHWNSVGWFVTKKLHSLRTHFQWISNTKLSQSFKHSAVGWIPSNTHCDECYQNGEYLPNAMETGFNYRSCTAMAPPVKACFEFFFKYFPIFQTNSRYLTKFMVEYSMIRQWAAKVFNHFYLNLHFDFVPNEKSFLPKSSCTRSKWALSQQVIFTW